MWKASAIPEPEVLGEGTELLKHNESCSYGRVRQRGAVAWEELRCQ